MIKNISLVFFIIFSSIAFSQGVEVMEIAESDLESTDVPFGVIENVPVYPECTGGSNAELKRCMSDEISNFVREHFDINKFESLGFEPKRYRVAVQFKIDSNGNVVNIRARAEKPEIEAEAVRVVSSLPKMTPGKQKGKEVGVLYSLPIIFEIEPESKRKRE